MRGLWFIAGNLVKDIAALNKIELLQWDAWSGMPRPNTAMTKQKTLHFFGKFAELTSYPDSNFNEIQKIYSSSIPAITFLQEFLMHIKAL